MQLAHTCKDMGHSSLRVIAVCELIFEDGALVSEHWNFKASGQGRPIRGA